MSALALGPLLTVTETIVDALQLFLDFCTAKSNFPKCWLLFSSPALGKAMLVHI